jgi:hypothetical protein
MDAPDRRRCVGQRSLILLGISAGGRQRDGVAGPEVPALPWMAGVPRRIPVERIGLRAVSSAGREPNHPGPLRAAGLHRPGRAEPPGNRHPCARGVGSSRVGPDPRRRPRDVLLRDRRGNRARRAQRPPGSIVVRGRVRRRDRDGRREVENCDRDLCDRLRVSRIRWVRARPRPGHLPDGPSKGRRSAGSTTAPRRLTRHDRPSGAGGTVLRVPIWRDRS